MMKEEIWSVSIQRARAFFREQDDVSEESANVYLSALAEFSSPN